MFTREAKNEKEATGKTVISSAVLQHSWETEDQNK